MKSSPQMKVTELHSANCQRYATSVEEILARNFAKVRNRLPCRLYIYGKALKARELYQQK
uniref:Uncharacterized protein n=1 Tax=Octopus bimaculoides TaxID=37653 RepID=A0A0L8GM19_OCTBM